MKRLLLSIMLTVLLGALSYAQGNADNPKTEQVAPGSVIPAELTKSVDAKKAKAGDRVQAKTSQELVGGDGQVAVPAGARIEGHVTEAKPHEKGESTSTLGIVFDKMVFKDGHEVPMNATIQALAPPAETLSQSSDTMSQPGAQGSNPQQQGGGNYGGMSRPTGTAPSENPGMGTGNAGSSPNPQARTGGSRLSPNAQGVVGISWMFLQGEVLTSQKKNVKLDNGTQLMLRVVSKQ